MTGASWFDIEALMNCEVSDTTLRSRRDEWIAAGVFDQLEAEARAGYDRIIEPDLDVVAIDGSLHKAPCGGEGTGKSPVDRAKLGWKWSVASSVQGSPSAGRSTAPTATTSSCSTPPWTPSPPTGMLADVGTLALDRSYAYPKFRASLHPRGLVELEIQRRGRKPRREPRTDSRSDCAGSSRQPATREYTRRECRFLDIQVWSTSLSIAEPVAGHYNAVSVQALADLKGSR